VSHGCIVLYAKARKLSKGGLRRVARKERHGASLVMQLFLSFAILSMEVGSAEIGGEREL
jgi:hypothetical protein